MSKIILFVKIFGAGSGNNANIGLVDGNLQWASAPNVDGWLDGIIDEKTVSGATQAINLSAGGSSGGFTGSPSIMATDAVLASFIRGGSINLNGKTVHIYRAINSQFFNSAELRFSGKISSVGYSTEITVDIACESSNDFNVKKIPSITVTKEMALGNPNSSAIGKSITPIYGSRVEYPLIYCEPGNNFRPISNTTVDTFLQASAPNYLKNTADGELLNRSDTFFKGKTLLQVSGLWQQTADVSLVWVTLTFNGQEPLFRDITEDYIPALKKLYLGKTLVDTSDLSKGYRIVDIEWNTHAFEGVTFEGVWLQLDTSSSGDVKSSAPFNTGAPFVRGNWPVIPFQFGIEDVSVDPNFYGELTEQNKPYVRNATIFALSAPDNVFLVHPQADLENSVVVTKNGNQSAEIDVDLEVLYSSDLWKIVRVASYSKDISDDFGSFENSTFELIPNYAFREFQTGGADGYGSNMMQLGDFANEVQDGYAEGSIVPSGGVTIPRNFSLVLGGPNLYSQNIFYAPIDDLWNGNNLSKDFTVFAIPYFQYVVNNAYGTNTPVLNTILTVVVDVHAIGEGNLSLGSKRAGQSFQFLLESYVTGSPSSFGFAIDPQTKTINVLGNLVGLTSDASALFENFKNALDITDILNVDDIQRVRYLYVSIRTSLDRAISKVGETVIVTRDIKPASIGYSKKVDKKNLFIRSNTSTIGSPVEIIEQIALDNGIPINEAEFDAAHLHQTIYFGEGLSPLAPTFNGFYAPTAGQTIGSIINDLAAMAMCSVYFDAANVLRIKCLTKEETTIAHEFGSDIIQGSLSISLPKSGYVYSDYTFEAKIPSTESETVISVNSADAETFPAENEYSLSGPIFSATTGFAVETDSNISSPSQAIWVSCPDNLTDLQTLFVAGTIWRFRDTAPTTNLERIRDVRIDSVASSASNYADNTLVLGCILLSYEIGAVSTDLETRFQLRSPTPLWRDLVSGVSITNYALAYSMWEKARNARTLIGREQVMPSRSTKLSQPIWGGRDVTITKWANAVINYGTAPKTVIRFSVPMNTDTQDVKFMDYVAFAWGPFKNDPISGYILEAKDNYSSGTMSFTMLCLGGPANLPLLLTEASEVVTLESGESVELEGNSESKKISQLPYSSVETIIAAGAEMVTAVSGAGNYRTPIADVAAYAVEGASDYTDEVMQNHLEATNPHPQYSLKESDILSKDRTGFINQNDIGFNYDHVARTITLTGDLSYLWRSARAELVSPWVSPAHPATLDEEYFLQSTDGVNFAWGTVPFDFANVQVAYAYYYTNDKFAIQETHGCSMSHADHKHGHDTAGTYRKSGGTLSAGSYLLKPTTPTDTGNRPAVDSTELWDEDKRTVVPTLADNGPYTQLYGNASNDSVFTRDALNIVPIGTTYPRYNLNGVLTEIANNKYMNVYRLAVPVCAGSQSGKYGVLWVTGTGVYNSTGEAQTESLALNLGRFSSVAPEFTECQRITISTSASYTTVGKFRIEEVTEIGGTKQAQFAIGGTGVTSHFALSDVQGGASGNQWHLLQTQHALIVNAGSANGVATLDAGGKIPSGQLPSYVDDVLEFVTKSLFPATGESGKIYVDLSTNLTWRWGGTVYVEISPSLALGETSTTAYRGDRGKTAYDHSQTTGNPHGTTIANISGLQGELNAKANNSDVFDIWGAEGFTFPAYRELFCIDLPNTVGVSDDFEASVYLDCYGSNTVAENQHGLIVLSGKIVNGVVSFGLLQVNGNEPFHSVDTITKTEAIGSITRLHVGKFMSIFQGFRCRVDAVKNYQYFTKINGDQIFDTTGWGNAPNYGITKTLASTGANEVYPMHQKAVTDALAGKADLVHASRHSAGGDDPVSIDLSQISNMSSFMRTVNDDASAADARQTLEASPLNTTLTDSAGSSTPPTTASGTLVSKIQALRNNVKQIFSDLANHVHDRLVGTGYTYNTPNTANPDSLLEYSSDAFSVAILAFKRASGIWKVLNIYGYAVQIVSAVSGVLLGAPSGQTVVIQNNGVTKLTVDGDGVKVDTPATSDNSTKVATTAWVRGYVDIANEFTDTFGSSTTVTPVNGGNYLISTSNINITLVTSGVAHSTTCYFSFAFGCGFSGFNLLYNSANGTARNKRVGGSTGTTDSDVITVMCKRTMGGWVVIG